MTNTTQPIDAPESQSGKPDDSSTHAAEQTGDSKATVMDAGAERPSEERHPIDILAEEYSARLRAGETPSIEEFAVRIPELATMIRTLFPTIALVERMTSREKIVRRDQRPALGRKRIGDFLILREVGRGGMGVVYEAIQQSLGRRVALKVLSSLISSSPHQLRRFRREAEAAARLHHTNIVPVYGIGEEDGIHFYAMQFIDGIPLAAAIQTVRNRSSVTHLATDTGSSDEIKNTGVVQNSSYVPFPQPSPNSSVDDPTVLIQMSSDLDLTPPPNDSSDRPAIDADQQGSGRTAEVDAVASQGLSGNQVYQRDETGAVTGTTQSVSRSQTASVCLRFFENHQSAGYIRRVAGLAAQVADALEFAHQHGVLHRDIKPSNLMIDRSGAAWITDFGLVKIVEKQDLTLVGEIVGTLRYMAPEQLEGRADARTDIYGLGLTLFELLTLKPAFDGDEAITLAQRLSQSDISSPRSINPAIPRDLETIVLKATAREPFARYENAAAFAEDLRRFANDEPIVARRASYMERLWRWSRRNPALATATMSSIVLLFLVAIVASRGWISVHAALSESTASNQRAEENLKLAIDGFDKILANVTSRGLPRSPDFDILEQGFRPIETTSSEDDVRLLTELLKFYGEFASKNVDNTNLRDRTAIAHRRAAEILVRLGRLEEAEEDYNRSIILLTRIRKSEPDNIQIAVKSASIYNDLGELQLRRGEFDEPFKSHLEARALLLDLPAKARTEPSVRFELARATDLFASIDIRSGTDAGPAEPPTDGRNGPGMTEPSDGQQTLKLQRSVSSQIRSGIGTKNDGQALPAAAPGDRPVSGRKLGWPPPRQLEDRLKKALPAAFVSSKSAGSGLAQVLLSACNEFRALADQEPENAEYQFRLAQCLRHRLVHAASFQQTDDIQDIFLEAIQILTQLRADYPANPKYLYELAETLTHASLANLDVEQTKAFLEDAVSHAEKLAGIFTKVSEYQSLYGTALARRAAIEAELGSLHDAEISLTESIEVLKKLADQFPDQSIFQIPLAKARQQLGDLLREMADMADATTPSAYKLQQSRNVIQTGIDEFERYLLKSQIDDRPHRKGHFVMDTRSSLYQSLARTLDRLELPYEAEEARSNALRRSRPGPRHR